MTDSPPPSLFLSGKGQGFFLLAVCAIKLSLTVADWNQKAYQMSSDEIIELANRTFMEFLWTLVGACALLYYVGKLQPRCFGENHIRIQDTRTCLLEHANSTLRKSNYTYSAKSVSAASTKSSSTTSSVIRTRTSISVTMERFLLGKDYQFEADMGMLEGQGLLDPVTKMYLTRPPSFSFSDRSSKYELSEY